ncbi:polysaccharide pyruvyl transferase family protein [Pseudoalteromonas sp. CO348]|uniref:polysaccharide pyruvyl transferase family protein n=1 Tax=Pseudoalteromonas TaxID=53246 RepID=UPI0005FA0434|nr:MULTISPECIES: polysaccharide pyruvyl transferase family protein [Pseudoalteromonas]KJZ04353.1 hypothetical protein TW73_04105 [Pseudoalteromonas piscicida]RZG03149.1 polysaccharide pyruvyl transferase family protein [Pseudoalteromonas sp. CO348]
MKDIKIGIITVQKTVNYGGMLQAFSSYKVMSRYGECELIDYENKHVKKNLSLIRLDFSPRGVLRSFKDILRVIPKKRAIDRFKRFFNQIEYSTPVTSETLGSLSGRYDYLLSGSDQIWNPTCMTSDGTLDKAYLLNFDNKAVKISYASSMGSYQPDNSYLNEMLNELNKFKSISVREADMVEKLKSLRLTMEHVVDPTLLLTAEEWLEYTGNTGLYNTKKKKRIVTYFLKKTALTTKTVKAVKELTNDIVRAISLDVHPGKYVDEHLNDIGPREFIREFYESDFIVTDSFHGVVFALIFRKPFLAVSHGYNINRIESLLLSIGSESRIITDERDLADVEILHDDTNYDELERLVTNSHKFINKSFS